MKPPEVGKGFSLPGKKLDTSIVSPETRNRVLSIPLFSWEWKTAGEALAFLLTTIKDSDVVKLLENLSNMQTPPPIMEDAAVKWFSALTNLPSDAVVVAVQEFFHLSWVWNQIGPRTGLVFDDLISLLYKVFLVLAETPGDLSLAENLIQKGIKWPERFGFMLERTKIGGGNIVRALNLATEIMNDAPAIIHETLIDFAVETGWYLLSVEDMPVWRSVGRNGESLYKKMRGFSTNIESIRILSGFLGKLEESDELQALIEDASKRVVVDLVGSLTEQETEEILEGVSEQAKKALKRRAERNIDFDIIDLPVTDSGTSFEYGRAIAEIILFSGAGRAFYNCFREAYSIAIETNDNNLVILISRLARERSGTDYLERNKTEFYIDFIPIVLRFLKDKVGVVEIKRVVNSVGRLMDSILGQKDPETAIESMNTYLSEAKISYDKLLPTLILLIRSTKNARFQDLILKTEVFADILDLLNVVYRKRLLEGEQTEWLIPLAEDSIDTSRVIRSALAKINEEKLRGRFMDKVIAPLLQGTDTDDPIFIELISTAVSTYNREMSIDQLRKEETLLLGKLFRAEDRSKALKQTMENLLRIPGIEEKKANDLIYSSRMLCDILSQQAVWIEKTGHRIFSKFLSYGLKSFVNTLVEHPDIAERITGNFMRLMIDTIIPSKETEDSDVALWQLKTAALYFGKTIPLTTELIADKPDVLIPYFIEISELSVSSKYGEPAGAAFLSWMSHRLESELISEFARKLNEDTPFAAFKDKFNAPNLMEKWRSIREASTEIMKDMVGSLQMLSSNPLYRQILLREGRKLIEGFIENGCSEIISGYSGQTSRGDIDELMEIAKGNDIVDIFRTMENDIDESAVGKVPEEVKNYFLEHSCPPGQNACRYWRKNVFSTLENVLIDIILLCDDKRSLEKIEHMIDDFVEIIGYLGADDDFKPDIILTALEKSLSRSDGGRKITVDAAVKNLDRNVYKLMWLRKATRKAAESVAGYIPGRKISIRLFDRISRETSAQNQILFMKHFGRIFASLESEIMRRKSTEIKSVRSVLEHIWIFNPDSVKPGSVVDTARDAVETVTQFFLEIEARTGAVSATEAGAISLGMRRKYRDNANTVAILIKWTQDSSRSDLLALVEAHQPLLEAVSRDSELIQMIDNLWSIGKARLYIRSLADRPDKLKIRLVRLTGERATGSNGGIHYT
ncbi:MAG: hypothetical protein K8S24_04840 [Candidatus Aegiribacteria sp.]|nr:hypothetical protein [Candidatus Aegiribacteria sp.]